MSLVSMCITSTIIFFDDDEKAHLLNLNMEQP